ncbi:hypothetical protein Pla175_20790 [Pirellulimonas nuda]|uniref:Uncharacterized protein n=1 Tax=Pirellulimonas nuda TaxID=2528009 RepID=A0A518DB50_9BACT|nr:response regulator [Pirellulimonas nuda]QDU88698.1 hypothetical protein Pla175_20790 [Pirellulimonas nuda]
MPRSTYFVQECPTCGRNLQVRVEFMGKRVVCQHCGSQFDACESTNSESSASSSAIMLQRAEELLRSAEASGIGISSRMVD